MKEISAILLGAGQSKRMGADKLSLPWGKKTMLEHCLGTLLRSEVREVIVVLNVRMRGMEDHAKDPRVKVVVNRCFRKGMSTSIRKGIRAVHPKSKGILIGLGDQPLIKTRTINALIRAFVEGSETIVLPSFQRKSGHPVIFHRRYLKELLSLKGDEGGRSIIEKHPGELRLFCVKTEGVLKDIDTWKDYRKALRMKGRKRDS